MLLWEIAELKEPYHEISDFLQVSEIVAENKGKIVFGETVPSEWKKTTLAGFCLEYLKFLQLKFAHSLIFISFSFASHKLFSRNASAFE